MTTRKQEIRQQIMATIVVFFMGMMVFGSISVRDTQAIGTNTTLTQNFVAGTLQLEAKATLGFADFTVGVAGNSVANITVVNVRDYRGSGAGWTVTGTMNNLEIATAGTNNISNAAINWMPGAFFGLGGSSNTGVVLGTGGVFSAAGGQKLINAGASSGMGNYNVVNTMLNILYTGDPTQKVGTYQNTLLMTII